MVVLTAARFYLQKVLPHMGAASVASQKVSQLCFSTLDRQLPSDFRLQGAGHALGFGSRKAAKMTRTPSDSFGLGSVWCFAATNASFPSRSVDIVTCAQRAS